MPRDLPRFSKEDDPSEGPLSGCLPGARTERPGGGCKGRLSGGASSCSGDCKARPFRSTTESLPSLPEGIGPEKQGETPQPESAGGEGMREKPRNFLGAFPALLVFDLLLGFLVYALTAGGWSEALRAVGVEAAPVEKGLPAAVGVLACLAALGQAGFLRRRDSQAQPDSIGALSGEESRPDKAKTVPSAKGDPGSALQLLALFQRKGRLVDFLQEDLSLYDDAQIGAAVRGVHQGCRAVLTDHVKLRPVLDEEEGTPVTVPRGFDPAEIQLTGDVRGEPPFRGTLRHRGWRIERIDLPLKTSAEDAVLAPAEVEIGG